MHRLIKLAVLATVPLAFTYQASAAPVILGNAAAPAGIAAQPASAFRAGLAGPAVIAKTYSAIVNADGSMAVGPAGAFSDNLGGSNPGSFEVIFPSNITRCVYTATLGDAFAGVAPPGFITVDLRFNNPNGVFVSTYNTSGARAYRSFHLHVQC
ncbi:MAG: hypothetical protein NVSMB64_11020 [Candidatus Velthaea sp.]